MTCSLCFGEGGYASPLTDWDWVPCDRCDADGANEEEAA